MSMYQKMKENETLPETQININLPLVHDQSTYQSMNPIKRFFSSLIRCIKPSKESIGNTDELNKEIQQLDARLEKNFKCYKFWLYIQIILLFPGLIIHIIYCEALHSLYVAVVSLYMTYMFISQIEAIGKKSRSKARRACILMTLFLILVGSAGILALIMSLKYQGQNSCYYYAGAAFDLRRLAYIMLIYTLVHLLINWLPSRRVRNILRKKGYFYKLLKHTSMTEDL